MAPELFKPGADGRVSFTSAIDTFAFGATVLALAKGQLPRQMRQRPPQLPCPEADFGMLSIHLDAEIAGLLNSCLEIAPTDRPRMRAVADLIGRHLLRDQHRALLVSGNRTYILDKDNRIARLSVGGQGSLTITYDGLYFTVSKLSGEVAINNMRMSDGDHLPDSCVIVLGSTEQRRTFITVDVSHPEVAI
jgi:hypothetical protein